MIKRRTLLAGTAGLVGSKLLTSCSPAAANTLKIRLLEGSVPAEVLKTFQKQASGKVKFKLIAQLSTVFQQLQTWQEAPETSPFSLRRFLPWTRREQASRPDNLVSLGDYWLTSAIAQNLLDPLELPASTLEKLPDDWRNFVSHTLTIQRENSKNSREDGQEDDLSSDQNVIWAAPYKVQSLVIVYRKSQFPNATAESPPFTSWRDLLMPQLKQKLALPNHPRVLLGLLQKMQSGRFNASFDPTAGKSDAKSIEQIADELRGQLAEPFARLNQQVRTYSSKTALKALVNEDVSVAVTWSSEAVSALDRYQDLRVVIPAEGSLLSADMWVRPKGADMGEAAQAWIDFCWQTAAATQISVSGEGFSPIFLAEEVSLPAVLENSILSVSVLKESELLLPLPKPQESAYWLLWKTLRGGDSNTD
ncbi:MAG: extracellular solute-binding protein [Cyanobacteria bacterium P01_A01_bin.116]